MKKTAALGLVFGFSLAQDAGIPPNLADWFASQASLALVIAALVALIRKHVWKTLDGHAVVGVSLALGLALAYLGHRLGYLGGDWPVFGLGAGLLASGGMDAIRAALKGGGGAPSNLGPGANPDAERTRLR